MDAALVAAPEPPAFHGFSIVTGVPSNVVIQGKPLVILSGGGLLRSSGSVAIDISLHTEYFSVVRSGGNCGGNVTSSKDPGPRTLPHAPPGRYRVEF